MANTNTNPLPSFLARTLRDLAPSAIPAALSVAFLSAPASHLEALRTWTVETAIPAELIGSQSRGLILEALSASIIVCGEKADACNAGTRTNLSHLARMNELDSLGAALLGG